MGKKSNLGTYAAFAEADADTLVGGRFAAIDQNKIVVGSTARPDYPPAAPHQTDPTGTEPPLNYDVTAVEPVGTFAEVQESLGNPQDGSGPPDAVERYGDVQRSAELLPYSASEVAPSPSSSPRRRKK